MLIINGSVSQVQKVVAVTATFIQDSHTQKKPIDTLFITTIVTQA